jgi:hypothetical protein
MASFLQSQDIRQIPISKVPLNSPQREGSRKLHMAAHKFSPKQKQAHFHLHFPTSQLPTLLAHRQIIANTKFSPIWINQAHKAHQNHLVLPSNLIKISSDCLSQDVPPYYLAHESSSTLDSTTHRTPLLFQTLLQARARITPQDMGLRCLRTSNTTSIRQLGCTDYGPKPQSH